MSTKNRADRIQLLQKAVTKHYEPILAPSDRSVLEHLIYACCLEDAAYDAADEAFHRLQESYFDWNEVRVTTVSELSEVLHSLPDPASAAVRIKKNLQSIFETRYGFDIDDMFRMNQGKAVQELERLGGISRFVLAYAVQNALGGHAIPVSKSIMQVLLETEVVSEAEAAKGQAPGLDRTIPKTKGAAVTSCLHQFAVELAASPDSKQVKSVLKDAGVRQSKASTASAKKAATKSAGTKKAAAKKATGKKVSKSATTTKKPSSSKTTSTGAARDRKSEATKKTAKKAAKKSSSKGAPKKGAKRKPR